MKFFFSPLDAEQLDMEAAFRLAAELGMGLELPFDLFEAVPALPGAEGIRALSRRYDVPLTVHLPFADLNLASLFPKSYRVALERTRDGLAFAEGVGARVAVLHTGSVPVRHPLVVEAAWARLEEALSALRPLPLPVALENLALDERDLVQGPQELARLLSRFPEYGFCLDYSHAFVEGGEARVQAYLDRLGDRLLHLHLNDTPGDRDRHLPVGAGGIPFSRLKPGRLPETATFEVRGGKDALEESRARIRATWDI